jgi:hypothetical protein
LNRGGGTYTAGPDDASKNQTSIFSTTTLVVRWLVDDGTWSAIVACVATKFAPFNVAITDVDPGAATHVEVVFAPQALLPGMANDDAPFTCNVIDAAVTFVATEATSGDPDLACILASSTIGTAFGLDFVTGCTDVMASNPLACKSATFTDAPLTCGVGVPARCTCGGGTTQDSFVKLLAAAGPAYR